eukprot:TRINITY_DN21109_c0_g1_i1.p2 TRINITY_DN21109_c0_g1~~TRINITY_DN21109_c0_g1_i1.p2  ORF type:complete len:107 (+),score=4.63 TRINITY_DN21109_c0_g1_i1:69-389(+)
MLNSKKYKQGKNRPIKSTFHWQSSICQQKQTANVVAGKRKPGHRGPRLEAHRVVRLEVNAEQRASQLVLRTNLVNNVEQFLILRVDIGRERSNQEIKRLNGFQSPG